jgi:hypothetical protein
MDQAMAMPNELWAKAVYPQNSPHYNTPLDYHSFDILSDLPQIPMRLKPP